MLLVTDMLCWRHEIQQGAKFNHFLPSLNRSWGTYIGHQHHNTPECDVGDWYLMLVPNSRCWWRDLSPTSKTCHQLIWSPTSVTNIDVTFWTCWWQNLDVSEILRMIVPDANANLQHSKAIYSFIWSLRKTNCKILLIDRIDSFCHRHRGRHLCSH